MTAVLVAVIWALVLALFLTIVRAVYELLHGWRLADRMLNHEPTDLRPELVDGLRDVMADDPTPAGRRHRAMDSTERIDVLEIWWMLEPRVPPHERPVA